MQSLKSSTGLTRVIARVALLLSLAGCGASSVPAQEAAAGAPANAGSAQDESNAVLGLWEGTMRTMCGGFLAGGRCNAREKITFTLLQEDPSTIGGIYTCEYGTQTCLLQNTEGKIARVMLGAHQITMRVMMEDGTSCLFNGRIAGVNIRGGYSCQADGPSLELGSWRAVKSY